MTTHDEQPPSNAAWQPSRNDDSFSLTDFIKALQALADKGYGDLPVAANLPIVCEEDIRLCHNPNYWSNGDGTYQRHGANADGKREVVGPEKGLFWIKTLAYVSVNSGDDYSPISFNHPYTLAPDEILKGMRI